MPVNGLPWWLTSKESACQCRRCSFDPWAGKSPWRRKRQPAPVFLTRKSHGQRSLMGYSLWVIVHGLQKSWTWLQFSSVHFSCSVVSDSLRPHEAQHARPPCPPPTSRVHSNLCPSSWRCHPAISSSVVTFSSCPQSLPASGSSPMSQLFSWGGQSTGVSASASVPPMNTQDWSPLGWTG